MRASKCLYFNRVFNTLIQKYANLLIPTWWTMCCTDTLAPEYRQSTRSNQTRGINIAEPLANTRHFSFLLGKTIRTHAAIMSESIQKQLLAGFQKFDLSVRCGFFFPVWQHEHSSNGWHLQYLSLLFSVMYDIITVKYYPLLFDLLMRRSLNMMINYLAISPLNLLSQVFRIAT